MPISGLLTPSQWTKSTHACTRVPTLHTPRVRTYTHILGLSRNYTAWLYGHPFYELPGLNGNTMRQYVQMHAWYVRTYVSTYICLSVCLLNCLCILVCTRSKLKGDNTEYIMYICSNAFTNICCSVLFVHMPIEKDIIVVKRMQWSKWPKYYNYIFFSCSTKKNAFSQW